MQFSVAAVIGFSASTFALITLPSPLISGSSVSCSSGKVYCTEGTPDKCYEKSAGQTCSSGSVLCCDSSSSVLNLGLAICGNSIPISIPVTVSVL